jgi:hypothetical protein
MIFQLRTTLTLERYRKLQLIKIRISLVEMVRNRHGYQCVTTYCLSWNPIKPQFWTRGIHEEERKAGDGDDGKGGR